MEQQALPNDSTDPATEAFSKIQEELALLRAAVSGMAKDRRELVIPDYTETLIKMSDHINTTGKQLRALASRPALELTPEILAKQITGAGANARNAEQAALTNATTTFVAIANQLTGFVASARKDQEQTRWLIWTGIASAILGALLWVVLSLTANALAPESWHWPEKTAASALGLDMWNAGERLQAVADPKRWKARAVMEGATQESTASCVKAVTNARKTVQCNLIFKSDNS
jgi:Family of unknown function (DUF6118)